LRITRGLPWVPMLLIAVWFAPSRLIASDGAEEPAAGAAARPTLEDIRGQAGLFGGFATAGADGLENGALFGGTATFFFTKRLGIDIGVHRRSLDVAATPANQLSGGSLHSTVVTGSLVVRFPAGARFGPYLLGGVAYFSNSFDVASAVNDQLAALNFQATEELKSGLGFNVGAGAEFLVARRLSLFAEGRYIGGSTDTSAELADTISGVTAAATGSQDLNGLEFRGGLRFAFAASRKVPQP
jgi:opacity protein-like surface antigen